MKKHFLTLLLVAALGLFCNCCYATIYARLEYSNYTTGNPYPFGTQDIGDLTIKLYSNAACTTPYVATSAVTVSVHQEEYVDSPFGPGYSDNVANYTVSSGSSLYVIATSTVWVDHYKPNTPQSTVYTFVNTITSSSAYTIEPTVYNP